MTQNMKSKKVTLKQVAAAAELAVPTVSQILNGRRNFCSEEQIAKVQRLAREMGYQPNIGYKIMTGQKTKTVGLVFSQERTYHAEHNTALGMRLITELEKSGESVYAITMGSNGENNVQRIQELINRGCSSFIFLGCPVGTELIFAELDRLELNYVSLSNEFSRKNIHNDYGSAYDQYTRHLLARGAKRFAFVMGKKYFDLYCRNGLEKLLLEQLQGTPEEFWQPVEEVERLDFDCSDIMFELGYWSTRERLKQEPELTGWIYTSDYPALGGAKALSEAGRRVGDDVWVYGLNNTRAGRFSTLPINTADLRIEECLDWLVEHLNTPEPIQKLMKPKVIFRN